MVQACADGLSARQAAHRFGVAASTAVRWVARGRLGELEARPMGNNRGSRLDGVSQFIFEMIEDQKDITLDEMVARLMQAHGIKIGRSALSNWLRAQGYTFKKRPHMHWSKNAPTL